MSKKIILAAILAAFTMSAVDVPAAFAGSKRNFNADGGRGGSRNSGDNSDPNQVPRSPKKDR